MASFRITGTKRKATFFWNSPLPRLGESFFISWGSGRAPARLNCLQIAARSEAHHSAGCAGLGRGHDGSDLKALSQGSGPRHVVVGCDPGIAVGFFDSDGSIESGDVGLLL